MKKPISFLNKCRICGSRELFKFLNLGLMPIPNGFLKIEDTNKPEDKYELSCLSCENCGLVQLKNMVNPNLMFKNYVYVPSESKTMMNNFSNLSHQIFSTSKLGGKSLIVDIGSNDGSLLSFFKNYGTKILGVDPAENLAKIAELKGIPTEIKLFNLKNAKLIKNKHGEADVITATNVIAHVDNLHDFFEGVSYLLREKGIFVTEFPYFLELIRRNEFDTIYHEHLSYFSLKPWLKLIKSHCFEVLRIQKLPIHGGSIRLIHKKQNEKSENPNSKNIVNHLTFLEDERNIYSGETLSNFENKVRVLKIELTTLLKNLKRKRKKIVGYGAAAKGNILTNYFDIGPETLDYIVDSTPYKQGLFTPGKHIPIYAENRLTIDRPDYVLILAWNFAEEIIKKEMTFRKLGGKFIIPIPKLKVV